MTSKVKSPKQTNQQGEGRKDEAKGTQVGRKIEDQANLESAQGTHSGDQADGKKSDPAGHGGQNSQGGQWGLKKGKGGQDSHNKR